MNNENKIERDHLYINILDDDKDLNKRIRKTYARMLIETLPIDTSAIDEMDITNIDWCETEVILMLRKKDIHKKSIT